MRKLIDLVLNEGELTVPQQLGQWARSHGGATIDQSRLAVKAMDTAQHLAGSGVFVVITVARHQQQGYDVSVDLVIGKPSGDKILDSEANARLIDGHSFNRVENADEAIRYAEQLRTTVKMTVRPQRLAAAIRELESKSA